MRTFNKISKKKAIVVCVIALIALTAVTVWQSNWRIPAEYDPTAPLALSDPITFVTPFKLRKIDTQEKCKTVLQGAPASPDKSRFLMAVRDGACELFGTVLSPDYNRAHANHFHFDNGNFTVCR